jgi:Gpi18-like mannosyltransferase
MKMKSKTAFILIWVLTLSLLSFSAAAADELLENGALSGEGIPDGWEAVSYLSDSFSVNAANGEVVMHCSEPNDLRLGQFVDVEENTAYALTAQIAAENVLGGRGAALSVDNYSIDGSYIYSRNIIGTADWQDIEMFFHTGEGQTRIFVTMRLGGYSEMSSGTARFRKISLRVAEEGIIGQSLAGGDAPQDNQSEAEMTEARKIQLKSYLHLFVVIAAAAGVFLLFGIYRNSERFGELTISASNRKKFFVLAVLTGLVLRSVLASAWGGHDSDMGCWMGWGSYIDLNGPSTFYTAAGHEWYDYPPGYMIVLGLIAKLLRVTGVPAGSTAAVFAYMLPAYAADAASAVLLMRIARDKDFSEGWQLLLGCLIIFNPAAVMLSGAWGQIDSILTLFLLLSFTQLLRGHRIPAGAIFGLAIMIKWQALIYGPVLAAAYLLRIRTRRDSWETAGAVGAAVFVMLLISLPFKGDQGLFWFVSKFINSAGGYDYASVEAYNFLALCGGNWAPSSRNILPGLSFKSFGLIAVVLSVMISVWFLWLDSRKAASENQDGEAYALFLAAAFCMYMIFTFGHYMHERYVFPVIVLLMAVFIYTREKKFLFCALLLSVTVFLNEMTAMYVISNLASAVVRGGREHSDVVRICSAAETISFLWFAHICREFVFRDDRGGVRDV